MLLKLQIHHINRKSLLPQGKPVTEKERLLSGITSLKALRKQDGFR